MSEALRETGIDIIGEVSWGTHVCLLYQTKPDLFEILVPYFKAGLEKNESCMWIVSAPLNEGEAAEAVRRAMPEFNHYLKKGQIEILPDTEWYLKEGKFNVEAVFNGWVARLNQALAKGYEGLRVAGSMFWRENDWRKIIDYEEEIKNVIARHPMLAICIYSIGNLGANEVIDVAVNHRFILIKKNGKWELIESIRLKRVEEELRRSEEQLRLITDSLPVLISYVDSEQCYRFINKAYENWHGLSHGEINGQHVKEILGESAYQTIQGYVEAALSGQQISYEAWIPYKSGGTRYINAIYVPDFDEGGKVKGFFALVTDNTERRKSEEQLIKYREHLEELVEERTQRIKELESQRVEIEKLAAIGLMAAQIAHEINNPLAGIKSSFLLIKGAISESHPYHEYVNLIEREINRIGLIVRQMFGLYKPLQEIKEEFSVDKSIRDVVVLLEDFWRGKNLTIEIDVKPITIRMAASSLRQVLYNVLLNAIEASHMDGMIKLTTDFDGERLIISISDQGIGIPPEIGPRIFEPFFTTKEGSRKGLGLGLSISKGIVETLKGRIDYESEPGKGTIFRIHIPFINGMKE
jgi:PAS domain S-box-containing protein